MRAVLTYICRTVPPMLLTALRPAGRTFGSRSASDTGGKYPAAASRSPGSAALAGGPASEITVGAGSQRIPPIIAAKRQGPAQGLTLTQREGREVRCYRELTVCRMRVSSQAESSNGRAAFS